MHKILLIGCGDIAMRTARLLKHRYQLIGLVRKPGYFSRLRSAGIRPILGDLDDLPSLHRVAGLADTIIHLAPPPVTERTSTATIGDCHDTRTRHLLASISRGKLPGRLVYISTSGVYGDCMGELVHEHRRLNPANLRAKLRVDAEMQIRTWAAQNRVCASILRVPGIYAHDRLPLDRLKKGTPAIIESEDSYTNHIHADDLARIITSVLRFGRANRIYHAVDDSKMKMGSYFDAVADCFSLVRPPRITRADAQKLLSPVLLTFMNESRRLCNSRLRSELHTRLKYPTVQDALNEIRHEHRIAPDAKPGTQLDMFS